jgi:hemerythrin
MLRWSEEFEIGHSLIDTQHKTLVNHINRLEGMSVITNPSREEVEFILKLVNFVETYIDVHFKLEEDCMESYRCPAHQENKEAHRKFLIFFGEFKDRFETAGCRQEVLIAFHKACSTWIQQHIMRIDVQLKPCLSGKSAANPSE